MVTGASKLARKVGCEDGLDKGEGGIEGTGDGVETMVGEWLDERRGCG